jgi:hypothetical protein
MLQCGCNPGAGIYQSQRQEEKVSLRLVLVCRPSSARQKYQQALHGIGVEHDTVDTLAELYPALSKNPYNGILMDVTTGLGLSSKEKKRLNTILNVFPVMRIDWDNKPVLSYYGQSQASDVTLEKFIQTQCQTFEARMIRTQERHDIHYNVTIYPNEHCRPADGKRAVTQDISEGGVFLIFLDTWSGSREIWMRFMDMTDLTPVRGEVKRQVNWGVRPRMPGLGVAFTQITDNQRKEIEADLKSLND